MKKKQAIVLLLIFIILTGISIIKINEKKLKNNHEYNIYVVNATLPTLLITMDMIENKENNTFLYYARESTLDVEKLKDNIPQLTLSSHIGNYESIYNDLYIEIQEYVKNILKKDSKAHFTLIVDEYRGWLEFPIFIEQGLTDEQYTIRYYSDGTLSYVANYEILKENKYDFFQEEKENYLNLIKKVRNGNHKCVITCDYLVNKEIGETKNLIDYPYDANYVLLATLRDNVEYYIQYPELIKYQDDKISEEMSKANIYKLDVKEKFEKLNLKQKKIFFELIKFDKETFDKNYFNDETGKYLIITGSNPFYGKYTEDTFNRLIKNVIDEYQEEYKILYKPHPSALPNETQTEFLKDYNISILPGQMPMEAISFVYKDLKLGGFPGSLYMSVENESALFFFEESKEELVSPLNILYDDMFYTTKIMN